MGERLTTFAWPKSLQWANIDARWGCDSTTEPGYIKQMGMMERPQKCDVCDGLGLFVQCPSLAKVVAFEHRLIPGYRRTVSYSRCFDHLIPDVPIFWIFSKEAADMPPELS